jgi:GNAT superfamily N-acetyltransferase
MSDLAIHPLTPDKWDDFVALFETDSMCRMCWCLAHRLPPPIRKSMDGAVRKKHMAKVVKAGPPPGLLAYRNDQAVGWLAIAPRPETPEFNTGRKSSAVESEKDAGDGSVWAATCFFVRKDARGEGVTTALVKAGAAWAKENGGTRLEACPMAHDVKRSTAGLFVGPKRVFDRAGFETVLERKPGRPLVRLHLAKTSAAKPSPKSAAKSAPKLAPKLAGGAKR